MPAARPLTALLAATTTALAQAPTKELLEVAAAYAAKVAASAIFVSGRSLDSVLEQEFAPARPIEALIRPLLRFDVDREAGTVTCRLGIAKATAVRTAGLGCVLLHDATQLDALRRRGASTTARGPEHEVPDDEQADVEANDWPLGDRLPEPANVVAGDGLDRSAIASAIDAAFRDADARHAAVTRAIVIVHRGQLIAERYAEGVTADTALPGWSMSKSLSNALLGFAVQQGLFDLDRNGQGDTLRALLTMTSGKQWREDYEDPAGNALRMLFRSTDHAAVFAEQPQEVPPGTRFQYASGSTNLLCKRLREAIADDEVYWDLPRQMFRRLGMRSAVLEADPNGTFVGSSYGFASARDWARLGLLFAQNGVFAGERLLPAGWVAQSTTPAPASAGGYGWQLWLNRDADYHADGDADVTRPVTRRWPDLPEDLFWMDGHEGQSCVISPTAQLVVVRLGCTKNGGFDLHALLRAVHDAVAKSH